MDVPTSTYFDCAACIRPDFRLSARKLRKSQLLGRTTLSFRSLRRTLFPVLLTPCGSALGRFYSVITRVLALRLLRQQNTTEPSNGFLSGIQYYPLSQFMGYWTGGKRADCKLVKGDWLFGS